MMEPSIAAINAAIVASGYEEAVGDPGMMRAMKKTLAAAYEIDMAPSPFRKWVCPACGHEHAGMPCILCHCEVAG